MDVEGSFTYKLPDPDYSYSPRGKRWYLLMASGHGDDVDQYAFCIVDFGETGDPTMPERPGAAIDKKFWGRWRRLDTISDIYIGSKSVQFTKAAVSQASLNWFDGEVSATEADATHVSVDVPGIWGPLLIEWQSPELLKATAASTGQVFHLYRSGKAEVSFTGKVMLDLEPPAKVFASRLAARGAQTAGGRVLGPAANVSLVIQNMLNASDAFLVEGTGSDGGFDVTGTLPDSVYAVRPLLKVGAGSVVAVDSVDEANANPVRVTPLVDGENLGTVVVTNRSYQFKSSIFYRPTDGYGNMRWFLVADGISTYNLVIDVENSGYLASPAAKITLSAPGGGIEFYDGNAHSYGVNYESALGSISAGGGIVLRFGARFSKGAFAIPARGYADTAIEVDVDDDGDGEAEWKDSVPLHVYDDETFEFNFTCYDSATAGGLTLLSMSIITPEGLLIQPSIGGTRGRVVLPQRDVDAAYRVAVSGGAQAEGQVVKYSFCVGGAANVVGADTAVSPFDNAPAAAAKLYANMPFDAQIEKGKSAFFDIVYAP